MTSSLPFASTISRRALNVALIGPPGSGKGSYGKLLAERLSGNLIIASDILHKEAKRNEQLRTSMTNGSLVDDDIVSKAMLESLHALPSSSSSTTVVNILDGFPRTLGQVHAMEETWPSHLKIKNAVSLEVPRRVCEIKLRGRRLCTSCGQSVNLSDVNIDNFVMPPNLCDCSSSAMSYVTREDDRPDIMIKRLDLYYSLTAPILNHYESSKALLRFAPYRGFQDIQRFETTLRGWLSKFPNER